MAPLLLCMWLLLVCHAQQQPIPSVLYGPLFLAVQRARVFVDQKTFCDAVPLAPPAALVAAWQADPAQNASAFVQRWFHIPQQPPVVPPTNLSIAQHIEWLWPFLTRLSNTSNSSLVPLPSQYVVPGSRFGELYYWDSYFIMLGLEGHQSLLEAIIDNFTYLLKVAGRIGNGSRTYLQSRSQPPVLAAMVALSQRPVQTFHDALRIEYAYWMGAERRVTMPDGSVLNRYWDDLDIPRDESFLEDTATCAADCRQLYRDIRAGAASGWDFSSRWLANASAVNSLCSIRTTDIVPVDLNALLFQLELTLARSCPSTNASCVVRFSVAAAKRRAALEKYLWCGYYCDFDARAQLPVSAPTAAMAFPLFTGAATADGAAQTVAVMMQQLLRKGGLATTTHLTGQQWDEPNGWAPLQWAAVQGMLRYGFVAEAHEVAQRFLATVERVYAAQGKLVEKYDVTAGDGGGGGGEYPLQDGFGWTNGVTLALQKVLAGKPASKRGE